MIGFSDSKVVCKESIFIIHVINAQNNRLRNDCRNQCIKSLYVRWKEASPLIY